jgi:hypothetical protein
MSNGGEINFTLRERVDRHGVKYLFGSLRLINSVIFIRVDPRDKKLFHAVVKPYVDGASTDAEMASAALPWDESSG